MTEESFWTSIAPWVFWFSVICTGISAILSAIWWYLDQNRDLVEKEVRDRLRVIALIFAIPFLIVLLSGSGYVTLMILSS